LAAGESTVIETSVRFRGQSGHADCTADPERTSAWISLRSGVPFHSRPRVAEF